MTGTGRGANLLPSVTTSEWLPFIVKLMVLGGAKRGPRRVLGVQFLYRRADPFQSIDRAYILAADSTLRANFPQHNTIH